MTKKQSGRKGKWPTIPAPKFAWLIRNKRHNTEVVVKLHATTPGEAYWELYDMRKLADQDTVRGRAAKARIARLNRTLCGVRGCECTSNIRNYEYEDLPDDDEYVVKKTEKRAPAKVRYETTWRNKWLTSDARSFVGMIKCLKAAIRELEAMQKAGIKISKDSAPEDDYINMVTHDAKVAKRFGMT